MMHARFELDITVEGKPYKAGDIVPVSEVPAGCLEALLRQLRVTLVEAPQTPLQAIPAPMLTATEPAPEPKPKHKHK